MKELFTRKVAQGYGLGDDSDDSERMEENDNLENNGADEEEDCNSTGEGKSGKYLAPAEPCQVPAVALKTVIVW